MTTVHCELNGEYQKVTLVEHSMETVNPTLDVYVDQASGVADSRGFLGVVTIVDPVTTRVEFDMASTFIHFTPKLTMGCIIIEFTDAPTSLFPTEGYGKIKTHVVNGEITRNEILDGHQMHTIERTSYQESIKYTATGPFSTFEIVECSMDQIGLSLSTNVHGNSEVDDLITTPNTTITHLTTTLEPGWIHTGSSGCNASLEQFNVSYPVFPSGALGYSEKLTATDCICALKPV